MTLAFIQNMGPFQLLICVILLFLLFGGKKIPEIARSLGKAKGEFKKGLEEGKRAEEELKKKEEAKQVEEKKEA